VASPKTNRDKTDVMWLEEINLPQLKPASPYVPRSTIISSEAPRTGACSYRNLCNKRKWDSVKARPFRTEISIGKQRVGFDRLDLDEWFEDIKSWIARHGPVQDQHRSR
jgi:hypothetical protein